MTWTSDKATPSAVLLCFLTAVLATTSAQSRNRPSRPYFSLTCGLSEESFENGYFLFARQRRGRNIYRAQCSRGFQLQGRAFIFCGFSSMRFRKNSDYSSAACIDIDECETSTMCHENATCQNTPGSYTCQCNAGFRGNGRTRCQEAMDCPRLETPLNGQLDFRHDGMEAVFTCGDEYLINGNEVLTCDWRTGSWDGDVPSCILGFDNCGHPGVPEHGRKLGSCHRTGCIVTFICNEGYWLDGPDNRLCLPDQTWSDYTPVCRPAGLDGVAYHMKQNLLDKLDLYATTSQSSQAVRQGRLSMHHAVGIELVLMFDKSSSIAPGNFRKGIEFAIFVLDQFGMANVTGSTRVAAITYGSEANLEFNLDNVGTLGNLNATKDQLRQIEADGGATAPGLAFLKVIQEVLPIMRPDAKRVIFIITDGHTTMGVDPIALARQLRNTNNFEIYAIGVGRGVDRAELRRIASEPYTEHVYPLEDFSSLQELADKLLELKPDYNQCGVSGNIEMVRQGNGSDIQYANQGAWPWLVMIKATQDTEILTCTGALICPGWVLTAAECLEKRALNGTFVTPYDANEISLTVGEHRPFQSEGNEQTTPARALHRHTDYQYGGSEHNLALIELRTPFILNKYVRPVCVPTYQEETGLLGMRMTGRNTWFSGWATLGRTARIMDEGSALPSDAVQQVKLPVVRSHYCEETMSDRHSSTTFCAGKHYQVKEACRGDTGGPLVGRREDQHFLLLGVSMSLYNCSVVDQYGLFTDVLSYGDWISDVTANCTLQHE